MILTKTDTFLHYFIIDFPNIDPNNIKIAAFDLDSTIIKTKSKKVMPESKDDWLFFANLNNMKKIFKLLVKKGFLIVILSNQKNLEKRISIEDFQYKISCINSELNFNISWMFALDDDLYRKPMLGMFKYYTDLIKLYYDAFDTNCNFCLKESFYCGDAAGRVYNSKLKSKDHSYIDMYFAHNAGIRFITPEKLFLSDNSNYQIIHPYQNINLKKIFGPKLTTSESETNSSSSETDTSSSETNSSSSETDTSSFETNTSSSEINSSDTNSDTTLSDVLNLINTFIISTINKVGKKICIIMVGCPGSGKSTIRHKIINLSNINSNIFTFSPDDKTSVKNYKLKINKSNLIIDSTNSSFKHRAKYYEELDPTIYNFLIIHFNIDKLLCKHLNHCRYHKTLFYDTSEISEISETSEVLVPEIAYRIYYKNYEDPNLDYSKLDDNYQIKVININNIKSIIDSSMITNEYYMMYNI
jgi:DNA 3'-phosphatase